LGPPQAAQNEKGEGAEDSEKVEKESKDKDKSRVLVFDTRGNKQSLMGNSISDDSNNSAPANCICFFSPTAKFCYGVFSPD